MQATMYVIVDSRFSSAVNCKSQLFFSIHARSNYSVMQLQGEQGIWSRRAGYSIR
jgi:hypothetical protein